MKRFDPIARPYSKAMITDNVGNYVLYSDYEELESELKEIHDVLDKILNNWTGFDVKGTIEELKELIEK
jgi:hypothetical protein